MRLPAASCLALACIALSACAVGPAYHRPSTPPVAAFKEAADWTPAAPADALSRGPWWELFEDPALNALASQVEISNQNLAAAEAAYRLARATVREQRASLFPTITLGGSGDRSGGAGSSNNFNANNGSRYNVDIGGSWEPDLWGRIRKTISAAKRSAQASEADLQGARLSAQGELAANYLQLREADAERRLVDDTVAAYQRALTIAQNRYEAGIVAKTDVVQAQTQLYGAQASSTQIETRRAQLEHAIAVLVGQPASTFSIPVEPEWKPTVPDVPIGVPSTLLQRRPDIAAAERRAAAANAEIGIAQAAYFPNVTLSGSAGYSGSQLGSLIGASTYAWTLGLSAAETLLDFGARGARVSQAKASYDQAAAEYRQTVLAAFQDVEDQLAAARILAREHELRRLASAAADEAERLAFNQYQAGQIVYSDVVTTQAAALSARQTLAQAARDRQTTAVALIQALGGGWQGLKGAP